jgi:hypothetical protein
LGDLDVEADDTRRVGGIGIDERLAAFRVAAPAQLVRLLCRRGRRAHKHERAHDRRNIPFA